MYRTLSRRALAVAAGALLVAGCGEDSTSPGSVHELRGAAVSVGNGTAQTVAVMDGDHLQSLGIEIQDAALQNLPAQMSEWNLPLPAGASLAPWDHATLNWNPQGHPPPGIYMVPHFDFHFYQISAAEQAGIQGGPDPAAVSAELVPPDYVPDPVAVPMMGVHWTDSTAAEFHGQPFQHTFIYGFTSGKLAFLEPMVTIAFLSSNPDVTADVKQPEEVESPGFYPTRYSVKHDAATSSTRVSLDGMRKR